MKTQPQVLDPATTPEVRVRTIDTHTAGEPTRIVLDGDALLAGDSLESKRDALQGPSSWLRRGLMWEPRGHKDMFGAVLVRSRRADVGVIFMEHGGCPRTCIHGSIGVATAVLDHALVPGLSTVDELTIETAGGILRAAVERTASGSVDSVAITQQPARIIESLLVNHRGREVRVNVVGSDGWVVLIEQEEAQVVLAHDPVASLIALGLELRPLVISGLRERMASNPAITTEGIADLSGAPVVFYGTSTRAGIDWRTFVMFGEGSVDRSPCGVATGNLSVLLTATGRQPIGEAILVEGSSGAAFRAHAAPESAATPSGRYIPTVAGSARVTGLHEFVFSADDEFREGFVFD